jgi:histidyl-tRNA synthetase
MRQFHQIGAEALGRGDPFIDAEILLLLQDFFSRAGVQGAALQLNSLGCVECRPVYRQKLLAFLKEKEDSLCENCRRRMERNPLRVLDCKVPGCIEATREAPSILESLCAECQEHFDTVQRLLAQTQVAYVLNPRMVRGLDYYCRTTFEWTSDQLGSQNAIAAGGRYDGLVEELGGPSVPGVGFAMGVERLTLLLRGNEFGGAVAPNLYIAWVGPKARDWVFPLVHRLRQKGLSVETDAEERSLKSQMRRADKLKAQWVLILGDDELQKRRATLRDMASKQQHEIDFEKIEAELMSRKTS